MGIMKYTILVFTNMINYTLRHIREQLHFLSSRSQAIFLIRNKYTTQGQ